MNLFLSRKKFSEDWAVADTRIYLWKVSREKTFLGRLQKPSSRKGYLGGLLSARYFPLKIQMFLHDPVDY